MDRLYHAAPLGKQVELLGGIIRKNRGREVVFDQVFELSVAGISQKQNRLGAARIAQRRAFLPDRDRVSLDAAAFESGVDTLFAVTVAVSLEDRHDLDAAADAGADVLNIMPERAEADNRLGPLRKLSHNLTFSPCFSVR